MRRDAVRRPLFRAAAFGLCLAASGLAGCQTLGLSDAEMTLANMPPDLAVDPFLWQGALETLYFLPIVKQEPSRGRIETAWGPASKGAPAGEEVKVVVQIYPGPISPNSVAVLVGRRVNGVETGVNAMTEPVVQEAILLRARQLKASIENE
ncbi:hypothetical protein sos41_02140 [Alphaproteobacteria bacterium SO-S41]|nr:hypothetical protein sos41_02140 [Alphaproteobacteria bacterium SO-S41]